MEIECDDLMKQLENMRAGKNENFYNDILEKDYGDMDNKKSPDHLKSRTSKLIDVKNLVIKDTLSPKR